MRNFTNVNDIGDLKAAVKEALEVKANRFGYCHNFCNRNERGF